MKVANIPLERGSDHNAPAMIVVHAMGEYIDTENEDYHAVEWLRKLGLSAHAFVTPSGIVIKSREFSQGAYHAKGYNTNTLGVEFLVPGLHNYKSFIDAIKTPWCSENQFNAGLKLCGEWIARMSGEKDPVKVVKRHSDLDPTRKIDPGSGFNFHKFVQEL
jgi:N-acetyl-anhydromuramyl-L-alanine amidase AmpD